ncbi:hypothetical protein H4R34_000173 [Dimargaris verticillata]|uniref:Uncharacterized protein n=1 Tax=Dimargaris verticillata TaxID=2761393 RepID=A0A9W8EFN6_9FUNG|nr:hypothetical protein H4R34_000173 [Dimargaris verticillata]
MRANLRQPALVTLVVAALAGQSWAVFDDDAESIKSIPPEWKSAYRNGQTLPYPDTPDTQPITMSPSTLSRGSSVSLPYSNSWGSDTLFPSSASSSFIHPLGHSGELVPITEDVLDTFIASDDTHSLATRYCMKHVVRVPSQVFQAVEATANTKYFKAQSPNVQATARTKALGYLYSSLHEITKGLWNADGYDVFEDATRRLVHKALKDDGFVLWVYRPDPKTTPRLESGLLAEPFKARNRKLLDRMSAHFYHSVAIPFASTLEATVIREYLTAVAIPAYNTYVMDLMNSVLVGPN